MDIQAIRAAFDRIAERYDRHAALEQEVCSRLLERCEFRRRQPERILDLGCGTGQASQVLKRQFRRAQVIALDFAPTMLCRARRRSTLLRPLLPVCADIARLPFAQGSADMLFSSLSSQWSAAPTALFEEFRHVLRPDGLLLFATLGPGTFGELIESWRAVDFSVTLRPLPDLMELGDALVSAGFREPVMDAERITLHYPSLGALATELECTGSSLLIRGWDGWKAARQQLEAAFGPARVRGKFPLTYEIVYGTAFGPPEGQPRRTEQGDVASFSVDSLLKSRSIS